MSFKETIIIKLGGSLIVPNGGIDTKFLAEFDKFIRKQIAENNRRFFIVAGGGETARNYINAGKEIIGKVTKEDLDWLGIHATRINAHLIRTVFKDIAHPRVIDRYDEFESNIVEPVVLGSGWIPGWSADYCAVLAAKLYGSKTLLKMGNIDMVYTEDPRKNPDAKPIERTTWRYFRKLAGDEWNPGMNIPIDPVAAKEAEEIGLTVIILKGSNFKNAQKLLDGKRFKGTVISPFRLDASFYDKEYYEEGVHYKGYTTSFWGRLKAFLVNWYRALAIKLFLQPKRVLDVGCGTGLLVSSLRELGVEAEGVEISKYALSRAGGDVRPFLQYADIMSLPYEDSTFDLVVTFDVLEHIESENMAKAIGECLRVSKKYCLHKVFTTENWWMQRFHGKDLSHVSVFSRKWWEDFFEKSGFKFDDRFFPTLGEKMESVFVLRKS